LVWCIAAGCKKLRVLKKGAVDRAAKVLDKAAKETVF
jgi:hypothetical protein